jgi:long-chain acyl-CoA synthetase
MADRQIETLGDIVRRHAKERPNATAMTYATDGRRWTYGRLDGLANRFANQLQAAGVQPQERVAYLARNAPEYFIALLGAAKAGCVSVAINWRLAAAEVENILEDSEARVLICGAEFLPSLHGMKLRHVKKIIVLGEPREALESFDAWLEAGAANDPAVACSPRDTAITLYTSGTTGRSKGVELTHANVLHCIGPTYEVMGLGRTASVLVCLPLFHIGGSGWGLVALYHGAPFVLLKEVDYDLILRVIPAHRITHAPFVPTVLRALLNHPARPGTDFSSLQVIAYGAAPNAESDLKDAMEAFGCGLYGSYGLSETTGSATLLEPKDHDIGGPRQYLLRSCGRLVPNHECRIVSVDTLKDVAAGEVGEIWLRGPQVMKGYWNNSEATTAALLPDGWLRTGDAGCMKDGYLYIKDRIKDMIISGGENIYPAEIENVLMKHPKVLDCAVIGVPHERWGETVKAVIRPADPALTEGEVIQFCRERIAHYKCPTSVSWVDVIPRGPSGKVLKTELRQRFASV